MHVGKYSRRVAVQLIAGTDQSLINRIRAETPIAFPPIQSTVLRRGQYFRYPEHRIVVPLQHLVGFQHFGPSPHPDDKKLFAQNIILACWLFLTFDPSIVENVTSESVARPLCITQFCQQLDLYSLQDWK